jgi:hypothetical protein
MRNGALASGAALALTADMTARRLFAALIALVVLAALGLQFVLSGRTPGLEPWGLRLWDLARYFTILTCVFVGLVMLREASGRKAGPDIHATAVTSIVLVGVIFQILLAPPEPKEGADWWTDFAFHAGIPVLTLLWWLVFGPKPLHLRRLPYWLIWPVAYCAYALVRGGFEGRYPYFFVDVARFGAGPVALNIVGLVALWALTGCLFWLAARWLARSAV